MGTRIQLNTADTVQCQRAVLNALAVCLYNCRFCPVSFCCFELQTNLCAAFFRACGP